MFKVNLVRGSGLLASILYGFSLCGLHPPPIGRDSIKGINPRLKAERERERQALEPLLGSAQRTQDLPRARLSLFCCAQRKHKECDLDNWC